jgi:hypothetical protein
LRAAFEEYQRDGKLVTPLTSDLHLGRLRAEYFSSVSGDIRVPKPQQR